MMTVRYDNKKNAAVFEYEGETLDMTEKEFVEFYKMATKVILRISEKKRDQQIEEAYNILSDNNDLSKDDAEAILMDRLKIRQPRASLIIHALMCKGRVYMTANGRLRMT